jgi:ribosome-binding ATPase YchF (GTP1/OBG family)
LGLQGQIEAEIAQLSDEDKEMFLEEYKITEPGSARVIRASYSLMHTQTFFTVGPDEVRGWSVKIGATAPEAAGVIHSDLQRGFIRAEVTPYEAFMALGGDMNEVKSKGKMRMEGKEYIVQDGDILNIRFNV